MDLIDELLERDAGTVNSTIIGKLIWEKMLISFVNCATSIYIYVLTYKLVCVLFNHKLNLHLHIYSRDLKDSNDCELILTDADLVCCK